MRIRFGCGSDRRIYGTLGQTSCWNSFSNKHAVYIATYIRICEFIMTVPFSLNSALNCTSRTSYFSCDLINFPSIEWLHKQTKPITVRPSPICFPAIWQHRTYKPAKANFNAPSTRQCVGKYRTLFRHLGKICTKHKWVYLVTKSYKYTILWLDRLNKHKCK